MGPWHFDSFAVKFTSFLDGFFLGVYRTAVLLVATVAAWLLGRAETARQKQRTEEF